MLYYCPSCRIVFFEPLYKTCSQCRDGQLQPFPVPAVQQPAARIGAQPNGWSHDEENICRQLNDMFEQNGGFA